VGRVLEYLHNALRNLQLALLEPQHIRIDSSKFLVGSIQSLLVALLEALVNLQEVQALLEQTVQCLSPTHHPQPLDPVNLALSPLQFHRHNHVVL
jgi:hypothetical protein